MRPDWIDLDGTANTRDIGGLPTTDGRRTVSGRLIRSDNLQDLSPSDVRLLIEDYGVAAIADLRAELEVRAGGPGPMTSQAQVTVAQLSLFQALPGFPGRAGRLGAGRAAPDRAHRGRDRRAL